MVCPAEGDDTRDGEGGGGGAAKAALPVSSSPPGGEPTACTLALWWLRFGRLRGGGIVVVTEGVQRCRAIEWVVAGMGTARAPKGLTD